MTERELQQAVIETAHIFGWRCAAFRPAQTQHGWRTPVQGDGKGWPDLILVRERMLVRELKCGKNLLTDEQAVWLKALRAAGVDAGVWTEHDWISGEIEAVLRREEKVAA